MKMTMMMSAMPATLKNTTVPKTNNYQAGRRSASLRPLTQQETMTMKSKKLSAETSVDEAVTKVDLEMTKMKADYTITKMSPKVATAALKAHARACGAYSACVDAVKFAKIALEATFIYREAMTPRELAVYTKAQYAYDTTCDIADAAREVVNSTKRSYLAACEAREALEDYIYIAKD